MSMTVTRAMLNGVGTCHGGYIYMVADSCMGYACNAHGRKAVLQHSSIVYLRPGRLGDRLVATAHMRSRAGRTALYDIGVERVTPEGRELLAEFRGQSRELDDSWV